MRIREKLKDIERETRYNLAIAGEGEPKIVLVGNTHYSWNRYICSIIQNAGMDVVLSEDLVDSNLRNGSFEHGRFYKNGTLIQQTNIKNAPVRDYVHGLDVMVRGVENTNLDTIREREIHFYNKIMGQVREGKSVVAEVGHVHAASGGILHKELMSSGVPCAILYLPEFIGTQKEPIELQREFRSS